MIIYKNISKHLAKPNYKRSLAVILAIVLTLSLVAPVFAEALPPNTPKEEVVYVDLNGDGTVRQITVVNIFALNEDGQIIDYGDYTALRNMTTNDEIIFEDETVRIDTKAGKLYYEGVLSKNTLPWDFSIRYYLDGTEYTDKDLYRKNGALKITMSIRQNLDCNSTFFENYGLQVTFVFDTSRCKNIVANGATAANVGKDRQLTYTILLENEKDITITADVTDFEMDGIAINGLPLNMDVEFDADGNPQLNEEIDNLEDAVAELDDGATELKDGAEELRDGALELKDGVSEFQNGANDLNSGAADLKDGAAELNDGAVELNDGAADLLNGAIDLKEGAADLQTGTQELNDGIKEAVSGSLSIYNGAGELEDGANLLYGGANTLYNGLSQLSSQNGTLMNGAYTLFEQLTSQAEQQLNASLTGVGMSTVDLTPKNYNTVISQLLDTLSGGVYTQAAAVAETVIRTEAEAAVKEQISTSITNDNAIMVQIEAAVEATCGTEINTTAQNYVALELAKTYFPDNPESWLQSPEGQAAVTDYLASADGQKAVASARTEIKAQYVSAAVEQQISEQMATEEIRTQIEAIVAEQLASDEVQAQIAETVNTALGENAAYQGIIALKAQLDDYNAFYLGLSQYTNSVDSAAEGAASIKDGASDIANGAGELYSGAKSLYDGLLEIQNGSAELLSGTITLNDGTTTLYNGVVELKDGTTELRNGVIELKDGTIELFDGTVELKDGVFELLDGAIELHDGTIELYDGTVELKDGTFEFRDKTAHLDSDLKDKINDAIGDILGGDFDVISFVSDKNTNIEAVQFVIKTNGVLDTVAEVVVMDEPAKLSFWQKLLRLFGLY